MGVKAHLNSLLFSLKVHVLTRAPDKALFIFLFIIALFTAIENRVQISVSDVLWGGNALNLEGFAL